MGIFSEVEAIGKALQEAGKIELYQKLLQIYEQTAKISEENLELKKELAGLKEESRLSKSLRFENNCYYEYDGDKKRAGAPYCSRCWDVDKKLVRLHESRSLNNGTLYFQCPGCLRTAR